MSCTAENLINNVNSKSKFEFVIVGFGRTGQSCARFLKSKNKSFAINDTRTAPPILNETMDELAGVSISLGKLDPKLLLNARQMLLSPGVSLQTREIQSAIQNGVDVIGDIELFCRYAKAPVVAITGSNGKSTVTTMITEMLKAAGKKIAVGGNIGTPALDLLSGKTPDYYVLELSSFQLETTRSLNACAAVVLNVAQDHMDRYADMESYTHAKKRIYNGNGIMVINLDDNRVLNMINHQRENIRYSLNVPHDNDYGIKKIAGEAWLMRGNANLLAVSELQVKGRHNISNALAALGLAEALDLPVDTSVKVLKEFKGLPHRCQWVAEIDGTQWINDSKGTNPDAAAAAITGLANSKNIILIAGGDSKGADFSSLTDAARGNVRIAVLFGKDRILLKQSLEQIVHVVLVENLEEAVSVANHESVAGDIVLLSPACSSLDMFKDYQDRGTSFIKLVYKLKTDL